MTSLPPFRRMLTPNSMVLGEPTKSIAAAAPPSVASITCFTASGAALSIVATAPIWRACARFCASISATIILPSTATGAFPAPDPWVGHDLVADLHAGSSRPERCHLARDFVSHRERQVHATGFQ